MASYTLPHTFRALRHPSYKRFFLVQIVSLIGTWITSVTVAWLVYRLTGSEFMLGLAAFCGHFPTFLLSPIGGVLVDRADRRLIFLCTQTGSMLQSAALAALAFMEHPPIEAVLVLAAVQGLINAFDLPARTSFLTELVPAKEDLPNAIALNSSIFNLARLAGPALAGFMIPMLGEGWCFTVDALSYLPVLMVLYGLSSSPRQGIAVRAPWWSELKEGVQYAFSHPVIRSILSVVAALSFFGMQYGTLMPAIVKELYGGGPTLLGILMSLSGAGAFAGAMLLATRRNVANLSRVIYPSTLVVGAGLVLLAAAPSALFAAPCVFIIGAGMIFALASCNTIVQTTVEEQKRGRVMSFYGMAFLGMVPLGGILLGTLAESLGPQIAVLLGGLGCLAFGLLVARNFPQREPGTS